MNKAPSTGGVVWVGLALAATAPVKAVGNTDSDHRAAPCKEGEVVVTFDTMPSKVSFDLPGHIKMFTDTAVTHAYRTWTSTRGTTVEARLISDSGINVTLQKRTGESFRIRRTARSEQDRQYLQEARAE